MKLGASYFANRILRHVREDMKKMIDDGCNFVVHTMSEHDIIYHSGTMVDIVKASRDVGLEVFLDPWGVGRVFGGESFSTFVKTYSNCRQRLYTQSPKGGLSAAWPEGGTSVLRFINSG